MNLSGKQWTIIAAVLGITGATIGIVIPLALKHDDEDIKTYDLSNHPKTKAATDKVIDKLKAMVPDTSRPSINKQTLNVKTNGEMTVIYGTFGNDQLYEFRLQKVNGVLKLVEADISGHEFDDTKLNSFNADSTNLGMLASLETAYQEEKDHITLPSTVFEYQNVGTALPRKNNLFKVADKYYTTQALAKNAPLPDLHITTMSAPSNPSTFELDGKAYTHYTKASGGNLTTPAYFAAGETPTSAAGAPTAKMTDSIYVIGTNAFPSTSVTEALKSQGYEAVSSIGSATPKAGDTIKYTGTIAGNKYTGDTFTYFEANTPGNPSGVTPGIPGYYNAGNKAATAVYKKTGTSEYFETTLLTLADAGIATEIVGATFAATHPSITYHTHSGDTGVVYTWRTTYDGASLTNSGLFETQPTTAGATPFALPGTIYTYAGKHYSTEPKARDAAVGEITSGVNLDTPVSAGLTVVLDSTTYTSVGVPNTATSMKVERIYSL